MHCLVFPQVRAMLDFMQTEDLIGTEAAAELAGVDRSTITRWVAAGRLEAAYKLPGRQGYYLFHRSAVAAQAEES